MKRTRPTTSGVFHVMKGRVVIPRKIRGNLREKRGAADRADNANGDFAKTNHWQARRSLRGKYKHLDLIRD